MCRRQWDKRASLCADPGGYYAANRDMAGRTPEQRETRARQLRAKMDAAFAAGASGYLIWSVTTGLTDGYDVNLDTDDPLLEQLRQVAEGLR